MRRDADRLAWVRGRDRVRVRGRVRVRVRVSRPLG
jgi:hypothetical protein